MLKIGLSGPGGTGKGTIGRKMQQLYFIDFIESPVESIGRSLYPNIDSFSKIISVNRRIFQYAAVTAQIQSELLLSQKHINYVSERSLFDYLAYYNLYPGDNNLYSEYERYVLDAYNKNPYDIIFYCAMDFEPNGSSSSEGDSWKERDDNSRKVRDNFLREKLFEHASFSTRVIELTGSLTERLDKVKSALLEYL